VFAVLNDYDLSLLKNTPSGRERTGTVPFVALSLLTWKAIEGKVHLYRHDVESFIWVLSWVSLQYENGKLRSNSRPFDGWLTVDAIGCRKEKTSFLFQVQPEDKDFVEPSESHHANWQIALSCLRVFYNESHDKMDDERLFRN
jgi:hypothetical protein